ncbi:MIP family channel protein [Flavilitoribacter nigricans]|uniref:Aquaporin n=1 Tax=Flavilitoribacter nigricans (strain ATCC 23147 / DSM 23189 / NBRC 102662 / NCIMB 1420 / SS-2) TaxID=1122177 RepID=A0A2D0N743_FLAN2|nr:MIP family channel protein [Flavilitoribacter nigricans]PHN03949.1 aquaporin [Flavilitoribacter nigricans DSM 23189 = NBRC 102662]
MSKALLGKLLAEGIGTFALVFCGTGAIVIDHLQNGVITHLGIALTFGLIVTAMIYATGEKSGAHLNPAVSLAFWAAGKFPGREVFPYALAQILGGTLASLLLRLLFPETPTLGETLPAGGVGQSFVLEVVLAFFLMFVIIQVATGSKEVGIMAGLAIGLTVLLEALFAGPVTGASMNPARSLAPALVMGNFKHLWIYLLAPVTGALLGILAWRGIQST